MRLVVALVGAMALMGCATSSLNNAQSTCGQNTSSFSKMWECIKGRVAANQAGQMNNEMGIRYMAFGDMLDEKYRQGRISNAEARLLLSQELARGNAEFDAKYVAPVGNAISAGAQGYGNAMQQQSYNRRVTCTSTPFRGNIGGPVSSVNTTCY